MVAKVLRYLKVVIHEVLKLVTLIFTLGEHGGGSRSASSLTVRPT